MKILVIQLRAIGDVICTTPALAYLKQVFPGAKIDFMVGPVAKPLIEKNPAIDNVIAQHPKKNIADILTIRRRRYDLIFDFMNNPKTAYISAFSKAPIRVAINKNLRSLAYTIRVPVLTTFMYVPLQKIRMIDFALEKMNVPAVTPLYPMPELFLAPEDNAYAEDWITEEKIKGKKIVIIMPIHKHPICRWRPEGFHAVANTLAKEENTVVYIAWGPGEEAAINDLKNGFGPCVRYRPPTTVRQLGAIFKKSALLLANNSGSMHVSVAVGTPTVTIYGPTHGRDWNPAFSGLKLSTPHVALSAENVDCLGCCLKKCPVGHLCMKELNEETVLKACQSILSNGRTA